MTEKLKEIIEKAVHKDSGTFNEFLIVPTGEKYDGFWGENGFDQMILLAKEKVENEWCILTNYSDAFHLINLETINFDIPSDLNCVRVWSDVPLEINGVASSVIAYGKRRILKDE